MTVKNAGCLLIDFSCEDVLLNLLFVLSTLKDPTNIKTIMGV
jgi:hypothetical protein